MDVLMSVHTVKGFVKIEWNKFWLGVAEILAIIHSIVELILKPIEVTDAPLNLVPKTLPLLIVLVLLQFLRDIHPLNIELQWT